MALPWPAAWPVLRFAAGVASALVFVYSAGWCLATLARHHASALGGVMFAGPGAGIVASGLAVGAMVAAQWRAASAWLLCGALAFVLSATVWRTFGGARVAGTGTAGPVGASEPRGRGAAAARRDRVARPRVRTGRLRLHHHRDLPAGDRARGDAGLARARFLLADLRPRRHRRRAALDPTAHDRRSARAAVRRIPDPGRGDHARHPLSDPRRLRARQLPARAFRSPRSRSSRCRRCGACARSTPQARSAC